MEETRAGLPDLASCCNRLAHAALPSDYALLREAGLASGHPWAFLADVALSDPGSVAYYRYLYGLARLFDPVHVLEIGTAFGLGSAAFIQGAPGLRKLISLDLGVFSRQYEIVEQSSGLGWPVMERYKEEELVSDGRNIDFAREALGRLTGRMRPEARIRLYRVNTQPHGTDNFDARIDVPRWFEVPELIADLEATPIDLLFIDGKHTGDGLYQDFKSFFRFVRPGGLVLCDDIHDSSYPYAWAGQTLTSFRRVTEEFANDIEDSTIWSFPQLPDWYGQEPIARPFGLVRKRGGGKAGGLPRGETAFVLSELEGLSTEDELVRQLRVFHRRPRLLAELSSFSLSDEEGATLVHGLKDGPIRTLLTTRPAAVRLLAERAPMAADMDDFQRRPAPSSHGTFAFLVFLLRRALSRRLRTRP
jgi:predicted O-methyltransferase YrrM